MGSVDRWLGRWHKRGMGTVESGGCTPSGEVGWADCEGSCG